MSKNGLTPFQHNDWYNVSRKEVAERGGYGVLHHYPSFGAALQAVYPEYPWDLSRFRQAPVNPPHFWKDEENLATALHNAEQKLGITQVP